MRTARATGPSRSLRSLDLLRYSGSTARILNLVDVFERHGKDEEYKSKPFFESNILNRSIILKHRVRFNEVEDFSTLKYNATKIIIPLDTADLKLGGRSFFVGQIGYDDILNELTGGGSQGTGRDIPLLNLLDTLPSFDPFLMHESMSKAGFNPARCYFNLSEAEMARVISFARREISPLITLSVGQSNSPPAGGTGKFVEKILLNVSDAELEPFRLSLGMDSASFEQAMFCWKGFIYYKWALNEVAVNIRPVINEISSVKAFGSVSQDDRIYIHSTRTRLARAMINACETIRETLSLYESAYADLTQNNQPTRFRDFLTRAPKLFSELGERLGAMQHIITFWRYRFSLNSRSEMLADELIDLLTDFEFSININGKNSNAVREENA